MSGIPVSAVVREAVDASLPGAKIEGESSGGPEDLEAMVVDDRDNVVTEEQGEVDEDEVSEDIRTELSDALSQLQFQGSFSFSRTYHDAPNPTLRLADLGNIGLPLSSREAKVVMSKCNQAPFGKGEQTVVDKNVRDTWELDSSQIHFDNPQWEDFLERVVGQVCEALGVNAAASKPRCDLYKLLLYETGSHFLPHVDTEKANGMFASIIIVLPTTFTGGDAHVSHGAQSAVLNSSASSATATTVLAWYTDVMHEVKPITGGYRLALAYNLMHTTSSLRPSLSDDSAGIARLRAVLHAWSRRTDSEPEKILYELDHKYSKANLSASALKGSDAHTLAVLDVVAKEIGFCLALGYLDHNVHGVADDYGRNRYGRRSWSDSDDDAVGMAEVMERNTTVSLSDIDGRPICDDVAFDEETDTIPENLLEKLEEADWDDQEYEGYQGNGAGSLDRYYRRTILMIYPTWSSIAKLGGDRRPARALDLIILSQSMTPTADEETCFASVLKGGLRKNFSTLCNLARRWGRVDLWKDAMLVFGNENCAAEIFTAISTFSFELVASSVEAVMCKIKSNAGRFRLFSKLESWAREQDANPAQGDLLAFVQQQRRWILEHLAKPEQGEIQVLTDEAIKHGGLAVIKATTLPQVKSLTTVDFWDAYARYLHDNRQRLVSTSEDDVLLQGVVADLLGNVVERAQLFTDTTPSGYSYHILRQRPAPAPEAAFGLIKQCLDYGEVSIAARALERVMDTSGVDGTTLAGRVVSVLLPLIPLIFHDLEARTPRPNLPLAQLCRLSIELTFESAVPTTYGLSRQDIEALVAAVVLSGKIELFSALLFPKLKALPWSELIWRHAISDVPARLGSKPPATARL